MSLIVALTCSACCSACCSCRGQGNARWPLGGKLKPWNGTPSCVRTHRCPSHHQQPVTSSTNAFTVSITVSVRRSLPNPLFPWHKNHLPGAGSSAEERQT
ncbi:hypothetical protein C8F01DRAFT_174771 [Mycena amicta]|nr:hypothetical protein C8F01DRAFT_174771 [Mycena amicta]